MYFISKVICSYTNNIKNPFLPLKWRSNRTPKIYQRPKKKKKKKNSYIHIRARISVCRLPHPGKSRDGNRSITLVRKLNRRKGNDGLRIGVVTPAKEHGDTAPHDVKPSSLFLNEASALPCKRRPPLCR